ncbi:MAG: LytR C-terminal domain-containing protein, partial [Candidatus Eremiobacteraeota bacterium]|nr:LytR C-terminal domain-containing protein [Candidatus Eremiobacteraeota bacterium]
LKTAGFVIGKVGNARSSDIRTTEVHQHSTQDAAAEKVRVALAFPGATVVTDPPASPAAGSDVTVVVGRDLLGAGEQASVQP